MSINLTRQIEDNNSTNNKIVGGYCANFNAQPVGGPPGTTGEIYFNLPDAGRGARTNFVDDIQYARNIESRKIILSVGGAQNGMSFTNRTKSQTFSIVLLIFIHNLVVLMD